MKLSPDHAFSTIQNLTLNCYYDSICLEIFNYNSNSIYLASFGVIDVGSVYILDKSLNCKQSLILVFMLSEK